MKLLSLLMLLLCGNSVYSQTQSTDIISIDPALAQQYFSELKAISDSDAGQMWGEKLYGPTMFVDPDSRLVVANESDKEGNLKTFKGIYLGNLPVDINISNTAVDWAGSRWTMVCWNAISQTDQYDRQRLLVHESWHRIQNEIGVPSTVTSNAHLDQADGRLWLLLEFRALSRALTAADPATRKDAITNALTFRAYRQSQFSNNNENAFELHEGLAEYTGLKLCGLSDSLLNRIVARKLQLNENSDGLANSFAYLTGPALGLLLDRYDTNWRTAVRAGADLPNLIAGKIKWQILSNNEQLRLEADSAETIYNGTELRNMIATQESNAKRTVEDFKERLKLHGRLIIPNNNLNFSFNPQEKLLDYESIGVIYHTMRLSGDFGVLEVTDGILRTNDWQAFMIPAPGNWESRHITGIGYSAQLNSGWHIISKGNGIFTIGQD
jgi:hypothetical protein